MLIVFTPILLKHTTMSRRVTFTQRTQLTTQLHKATANHSLHTQAEHRMQ
jgi:hypothetical protein